MKTSAASRNAMLDTLCALANGGTISLYAGSQPASPETAAGSTALVTNNLAATAFAPAAAGVATAGAIADGVAVGAGTAGWFRIFTSGAVAIWDGTVGTSGADLVLSSVAVEVGDTVSISSFTVTLPQ